MTIGVPGNVPYVITAGAMSDNYTPADASDDILASFSSAGPTVEGFVKPELVAPGGHILGLMTDNTLHRHQLSRVLQGRRLFRDVGHLPGDGRHQRHRRPDAGGGPESDAPTTSSAG